MPKPCSSKGNRLNNYCTNLPQNKPENQSTNNAALANCIAEKRLTEALEILAHLGYYNTSAIRKIQYFQWEGLA